MNVTAMIIVLLWACAENKPKDGNAHAGWFVIWLIGLVWALLWDFR